MFVLFKFSLIRKAEKKIKFVFNPPMNCILKILFLYKLQNLSQSEIDFPFFKFLSFSFHFTPKINSVNTLLIEFFFPRTILLQIKCKSGTIQLINYS